ncbi:hypothetical protein H7J71_25190 [Mycolicibacterium peregrinum]|uniref:hypothetical protein n=1 Tax=Mycolicibacterium peregrinum TaxID=43304 RepID=UPI0006D80F41|nr:hypothetical protein [Mycolicibacterium peregrinum]MCV7205304.1 hypothetical protein [Mycolicibacterium peregrinum]ORW54800.1 hypothetical protein AWC21_23950 [Mycolicibacterium peregrinum]
MARQGFKRNAKAVARILHNVDGGKRAAAEKIRAKILADNPELDERDVFLKTYHTDREVVGIVMPADLQAKYGIGTRAAQQVASD